MLKGVEGIIRVIDKNIIAVHCLYVAYLSAEMAHIILFFEDKFLYIHD